MIRVDRSSEPYSDFGNVSGQGARRLLGAPSSDPLVTAIRESVQNSWDARNKGQTPKYELYLRKLDQKELRFFKEVVFRDLSTDPESRLKRILSKDEITVLDICDYQTTGLDGPTRSSALGKGETSRFVKFLRNIGGPREEQSLSGGTYGYGKSSLFSVSNCETIVVDSVATNHQGMVERRFMAARTGEEFHDGERAYTGRHWWGCRADDGVVDPIIGEDAEFLACGLGMPVRKNMPGTSIMIIEPDLGDEVSTLREAAERMVRALMWYFWPKMVGSEGISTPMEFRVHCEGEPVHVPEVDEAAPFSLFADALRIARSQSDPAVRIRSKRPKQHLGWMAAQRDFREERYQFMRGNCEPKIPEVCHHIALMRPAELVVKYLTGNQLADRRMEWGGVFICSDEEEVESAFAEAEPPAHDDWVPQHLPGGSRKKTYVNVALKRIREEMERISPETRLPRSEEMGGFAASADRVGGVLLHNSGDRAVPQSRDAGRTSGSQRKVRLRNIVFSGLVEEEERPVARFEFEIAGPAGRKVQVTAQPLIVTEGREKLEKTPEGERPEVVRWRLGEGKKEDRSRGIRSKLPGGTVQGEVMIRLPSHVAITPGLKLEELPDE
ncbi:hypothetical protein [Natronospira bacteriovora]|uniref:Uncharacterized protein n=1 Tax=Natronospira bacteriovora TaxID=3069753 RepID=A0ABU0W415_9GAMM|nr:hypothetical protein [Natronospira sp. AB-CW4]MDQ2068648.1 hypothetical protein [Natronospira sp. AB-CW4]